MTDTKHTTPDSQRPVVSLEELLRLSMEDTPGEREGSGIPIAKFWAVFKRHKWWVLAVVVVVATVFVAVFPRLRPTTYTATAVIRFLDQRKMDQISATTDFGDPSIQGKVAILRTNDLVGELVDSLNLNFIIQEPKVSRFALFQEIVVSDSARYGEIELRRDGEQVQVYFTDFMVTSRMGGIDPDDAPKEVKVISLRDEGGRPQPITVAGIRLTLHGWRLDDLETVKCYYLPRENVIRGIKGSISARTDRSSTILNVGYTDRDPYVAAWIVNALSRIYIEKLGEYNQVHTNFIVRSLRSRLTKAQAELQQSEDELERFRRRNPYVALSVEGDQTLGKLTDKELEVNALAEDQAEFERLLAKKERSLSEGELDLAYQALLEFLNQRRVPGVNVYIVKYANLSGERQVLLDEGYPPTSPLIVKSSNKIEMLRGEIDERLNGYRQQLDLQVQRRQQELTALQSRLNVLPQREIQLAELRRNRAIKEKIVSSILEKINEASVSDAAALPDAYVIDEALPPLAVSPLMRYAKFGGIGLFLGGGAGMALVVLLGLMDKTIREPNDIHSTLRLPVLATIPYIKSVEKSPAQLALRAAAGNGNGNGYHDPGENNTRLVTSYYTQSIESEVFRLLRARLHTPGGDPQMSLMVSSLNPGEGKSFVVSNLAITFAQQKRPTLIVDADLRKGVQHGEFGLKRAPGLSDFLISKSTIDKPNLARVIQKTTVPNLHLLSSGKAVPNPSELLGSLRMQELFKILRQYYSVIIFDTPPFRLLPDVLTLRDLIPEVLIVTRFEQTNYADLKDNLGYFHDSGLRVQGVVLNASNTISRSYKNYKYSYYRS